MAILLKFRRRCNGFPSAAVRSPDFDELAVPGQPTGRMSRCPLLAQSSHSSPPRLMSAFGGKADGNWSPCFRLLLTQSRHSALSGSAAYSAPPRGILMRAIALASSALLVGLSCPSFASLWPVTCRSMCGCTRKRKPAAMPSRSAHSERRTGRVCAGRVQWQPRSGLLSGDTC